VSPLELIFDYFEDHVRLAAHVRETRPLAVGILGFLVGGLSVFMAQALANRLHLLSFSWTSLAVVVVWKIIAGFLLAAVLHLILELQGLKGDVVGLFILFGLADLTWALAVPLVLIVKAVSGSTWLVTAMFLVVGYASLSLKARSLQDSYKITSGKAWFTLFIPYGASVALGMLALSLLVLRLILEAVQAFS
jgi:hypothetical protein